MDKKNLASQYHDIFYAAISWRCETSEFCFSTLKVKMPTFANNSHTLELFKSVHTQMPLICMLGISWSGCGVVTYTWFA